MSPPLSIEPHPTQSPAATLPDPVSTLTRDLMEPLGLLLLDADGRVIRANQAAQSVLGHQIRQLEGRPFAGFLDTSGERRVGPQGDVRMTRPDGDVRWVRVSHVPLGDADVKASQLVSVEDVTARRQVDVELQTGQRLEAMGRLAAGVAHEINTPIQFVGDNVSFLADAIDSLLGVIDVLVDDLRDVTRNVSRADRVARVEALLLSAELDFYREESPLAASQAQDGVGRIATIVRAMKALGHPDQGKMIPADLDQCLRDTVTVTRGSIKQVAQVDLRLGGLPAVLCLPTTLSQVVMNLIVNAADAIRGHRGDTLPGLIQITSAVDGDDAVITVTDDGGGIPPEVQDRVFEPFFTTKDVGQGTGQGLALARNVVVEVHGGSLTFDTTPGVGTTFTMRLPLDGSQPDDHGTTR